MTQRNAGTASKCRIVYIPSLFLLYILFTTCSPRHRKKKRKEDKKDGNVHSFTSLYPNTIAIAPDRRRRRSRVCGGPRPQRFLEPGVGADAGALGADEGEGVVEGEGAGAHEVGGDDGG